MRGTGEGVSKWILKEIGKLKGIKSNLTSTNKCKLKSVQLQVIVNIVIYSLSVRKQLKSKEVLLTSDLLIKNTRLFLMITLKLEVD